MLGALTGAVEQGLIYGIMALGVYLTFRVLDFPDLTVDGSFVTGASTAAMMIVLGYSPLLATIAALAAGFIAGIGTGLLHTKGGINPLLSGILMMIALYSINLRIMGLTVENSVGRPNIPLLQSETLITKYISFIESLGIPTYYAIVVGALVVVAVVKIALDLFLKTEVGLALRATGDNKRMIRSFSGNTDRLTIIGLAISNGLVALSGALIAQYGKFADVGMGIGMIVIGLASVIIGEALFGTKSIVRITLAVIVGAVIYRLVLAFALRIEFLDTGDMKLLTALIVVLALVLPTKLSKLKKQALRKQQVEKRGGVELANHS
ncbi:ABC transporter permease [Chryseomicrobium aureum]|uniref:ABC transporter permease n=1 Tax=Chryseomicrobium aureum TaxID=1441723 RepID=UPI00195C2CDC|nr:ABC transporter permease [Chryseomicrobium aureum]MBM7705572.1 putative ABC transport system permease protein [Chryseomicrobium aureum]